MTTVFKHKKTNQNSFPYNYLALDLINIKEDYNDLMQIYTFLDDIIKNILHFTQIHKPILIPYYHGKIKQDCGVSCYSFFNGGHITLHIFEKRKLAYLDIVSEQPFDINNIVEYVLQKCETETYNIYTNKTKKLICKENIFGPHYFAYGTINNDMDVNQLLTLQQEIISKIKMTPITNPVVVNDGSSLKLFIAIAESHIALTLNKKQLLVDIFSCKMFQVNSLHNILNKVMKQYNETMFSRLHKKNNKH